MEKTVATNLEKKITELPQLNKIKGIGPKVIEKLNKLGIDDVQDLLFHLPRKYQDRTRIVPIQDLIPGQEALIQGNLSIVQLPFSRQRKSLLCKLTDGTGSIGMRFFHFNRQQLEQFKQFPIVRCYGEVRIGYHGLEMVHPEYQLGHETLSVSEYLTPIYPTIKGLSQGLLRRTILSILQSKWVDSVLQELLPQSLLKQKGFLTLSESLKVCHQPTPDMIQASLNDKSIKPYQRLIFEELLAHQVALMQSKTAAQKIPTFSIAPQPDLIKTFKQNLPFSLTNAQSRVAEDIIHDFQAEKPMNRLLQGDVGSGKTVLAMLAAYLTIKSGYQAAIMAPTELLAEQHAEQFTSFFAPLGISVILLTNKTQTKSIRESVSSGLAQIIIGTHALFQQSVQYEKLALVIIDEQHRFGVEQRLALRKKGIEQNCMPHQLIMTATPIPRSLTMVAYADLDYSVIDELPPGRQPIQTLVMPDTKRDEIIERVKIACEKDKRQVYWVCTLIEESEVLDSQAAEQTYELLKQKLPRLRIGLLHSRVNIQDKQTIMHAFSNGSLDLLIATTVIEVGINVPNASLMIIENPERLGLAQLHQLRGRVGRGEIASFCILMYHHPLSHNAKARLSALKNSQDGFYIAQKDLELRGPGQILGTNQTGATTFKIADIIRDQKLLPEVQQSAQQLLENHTDCIEPLICRWLGTEGSHYANV